jgi:hypothetical protein
VLDGYTLLDDEPALRGHDGCHAAARLPVAVRNVDALVTRDRP